MSVNPSEYRPRCFNEYGRQCQNCGSGENIHVHHINGNPEDNNTDNLIPLCRDCHNTVHIEDWDVSSELLQELRNDLPDASMRPTRENECTNPNFHRTSVSIKQRHLEWLRNNHVKFGPFVRAKLNEEMQND